MIKNEADIGKKLKSVRHSYLWTINLQQRRQEHTTGKRQSLQQVVLGKLDSHM